MYSGRGLSMSSSFPGAGMRAGARSWPQALRPGVNTLEILAELGFTYHIDDLSADEPFLQTINGQAFATVPYSVHLNDIASFDFPASTRPATSSR